MALSSGVSFLVSSILTVILFAAMQIYKSQLASTEWLTIVGGFLGSGLFILLLTAISNLETSMFGHGFQAKLFPEVIFCLAVAMFSSGLVHRVCVTTCVIFSLVALYYINRIGQNIYAPIVSATPVKAKKR